MKTESEIRAIHNHVIEGTVRFDPIRNKQICEIKTRGIDGQFDGNIRTLATSDLHQTFWTVEVKKALDKLKSKSKRANRKGAKVVPMARSSNADSKGFTTEFHGEGDPDDEEVVILGLDETPAVAEAEVAEVKSEEDKMNALRQLVGATE